MGLLGTARNTHLNRALVVLSMDLIITMIFGVIGEFPCFMGLKFRIAEMIFVAIAGRVRMRMARQFKVASTMMGSLPMLVSELSCAGLTYVEFS